MPYPLCVAGSTGHSETGSTLFRRMKTGGRPQSNPSEDLGRNAPQVCRVKIDGVPQILRTDPPLTTPPQTAKRSQHPHGSIGSRHGPLAETAGSPLAMSPTSQMKLKRPPFARSRYTGITGWKYLQLAEGRQVAPASGPPAQPSPETRKNRCSAKNSKWKKPIQFGFPANLPLFLRCI